MIGTEYFERGTEPGEACHLHVGRSLFGRLAGWFGAAERAGQRAARRRRRASRGAGGRAGLAGAAGAGGGRGPGARSRRSAGSGGGSSAAATSRTRRTRRRTRRPPGVPSSVPLPMPFRDVIGHARQVALLAGAVQRGSLPPTLLFAGPPGVGKWRIAQALAQAVNCPAPVQGDALRHVPVVRSDRPRPARGRHRARARRHRQHQGRPGARGPEELRLPARSKGCAGSSPCATPTPSPNRPRTRSSSRSRSRPTARCSSSPRRRPTRCCARSARG